MIFKNICMIFFDFFYKNHFFSFFLSFYCRKSVLKNIFYCKNIVLKFLSGYNKKGAGLKYFYEKIQKKSKKMFFIVDDIVKKISLIDKRL